MYQNSQSLPRLGGRILPRYRRRALRYVWRHRGIEIARLKEMSGGCQLLAPSRHLENNRLAPPPKYYPRRRRHAPRNITTTMRAAINRQRATSVILFAHHVYIR